MTAQSYSDGLRDGKIQAVEEMQSVQNRRLDKHELRLSTLEKVSYALVGAIALMELLPHAQALLGG